MPELVPQAPPLLAAMSAADEAAVLHRGLSLDLAAAIGEAEKLDEALRRVETHDAGRLERAGQAFADGLGRVEVLVRRIAEAQVAVNRAQQLLAQTRLLQNRARLEELRVEMEIDAASIWDLAGQFEAAVRARLEEHARLADELHFIAAAVGEPGVAVPAAEMLTPALGTSGPALWSALAGGVRQLHDRNPAPLAPPQPALPAAERFAMGRSALPPVATGKPGLPPATPPVRPAAQASVEVDPTFGFPRPAAKAPAKPPSKLPVTGPVPVGRIPTAAELAAKKVAAPPGPVEPPRPSRGRFDRMLNGLAGMVGRRSKRRLR